MSPNNNIVMMHTQFAQSTSSYLNKKPSCCKETMHYSISLFGEVKQPLEPTPL